MTVRAHILRRIFEKIAKKSNWSHKIQKSIIFWVIYQKGRFPVLHFNFNFLNITPEYIDPSGHLVFYEILRSSNFFGRTLPKWCSRGSSGARLKKNWRCVVG